MFDQEGMKQVVSAAVISALTDKGPELLREMVDRALKKEVNQYGGEPKYGDQKMTLLESVAGQQIQLIIQEAVREWFAQNKETFKAQVNEKLIDGGVANTLVESVIKTITDYGFRVEVLTNRDR